MAFLGLFTLYSVFFPANSGFSSQNITPPSFLYWLPWVYTSPSTESESSSLGWLSVLPPLIHPSSSCFFIYSFLPCLLYFAHKPSYASEECGLRSRCLSLVLNELFACVCECSCVCRKTHMCKGVHRPQDNLKYYPEKCHQLPLNTGPLISLGLTSEARLADQLQRLSCVHLPRAGIKGLCHHAQLLHACWRCN